MSSASPPTNVDSRNDEERIIESIQLEGERRLYEDFDFLPIRQSLYSVENAIPDYDDEVGVLIQWHRATAICEEPEYFSSSGVTSVSQGTLQDEAFIGALIAVSIYRQRDLIQHIFWSRPTDFRIYGLYTCKFYVEGEWVEVMTDTFLPCVMNVKTNSFSPVYSRSPDKNELWITLAEKCYAKAVGNYESIKSIKVQEALVHLTGGSVQHMSMHDDAMALQEGNGQSIWKRLVKAVNVDNLLVTALPAVKSEDELQQEGTTTEHKYDNFIPNRLYSIVLCHETTEFELILCHNPWSDFSECWKGEWGNRSVDWDLNPELISEIENDPRILWRKSNPRGYFWISFKHFKKFFNQIFFTKLFPSEDYRLYCMKDEWKVSDRRAGGPLVSLRDKTEVNADAAKSRSRAIQKASIAAVVDGDCSWFNNPQLRISSATTNEIFVSMVPGGGDQVAIGGLAIVRTPKNVGTHPPLHIWDGSISDIVCLDADASHHEKKIKGQEVSIWNFNVDPNYYYHIISHTSKKGQEGSFVLRLFAKQALTVENIPPLHQYFFSKAWVRSGDIDSTGGPLTITVDGQGGSSSSENSKWCQNPQFHLEPVDPFGRDEIFIKFVLKRSDKGAHKHATGAAPAFGADKSECMVGMTVCKASVAEDSKAAQAKKKQPRQNAMGELIPKKESSLQRKGNFMDESSQSAAVDGTSKQIVRKASLAGDPHVFASTYCSRTDSTMFFPKLCRSWMPNGLMCIPSLSEKGQKGTFDLEIYSSEPLNVKMLNESFSRSIASEWSEATACGSHINPNWKRNPKFQLKFNPPVHNGIPVLEDVPVKIRLGRHGVGWKNMMKKDPVGCLMGFYVFLLSNGEMRQVYESTFVPTEELSVPFENLSGPGEPDKASFALPAPRGLDEYIIMPCVYGEGKLGSFILTVTMDVEFTFMKEKT